NNRLTSSGRRIYALETQTERARGILPGRPMSLRRVSLRVAASAKERGSNDEEAHPSRGRYGSRRGDNCAGGTAAESGQERPERRAHVQGTTRGEPDALQDDVGYEREQAQCLRQVRGRARPGEASPRRVHAA